ncbi:hypothetical protein [Pseudonocardia sp. DLS-67]
MEADSWLVDTRTSYDTVAAGYADQLRDALAGYPYLCGALASFADMVRAAARLAGCGHGCAPLGE